VDKQGSEDGREWTDMTAWTPPFIHWPLATAMNSLTWTSFRYTASFPNEEA